MYVIEDIKEEIKIVDKLIQENKELSHEYPEDRGLKLSIMTFKKKKTRFRNRIETRIP